MQFNVAQLLKEPVGSTRRFALNEAIAPQPDADFRWIRGEVHLLRTNRSILLTATLETSATCACSRCLEPYPQAVALSLEEEFFPSMNVTTGAPLTIAKGHEGGFTIDEHHLLDLREAVRQYTITSLPMKPLCQSDCPGICPQCGVVRKEQTCSCASTPRDPRWEPLLNLLSKSDS